MYIGEIKWLMMLAEQDRLRAKPKQPAPSPVTPREWHDMRYIVGVGILVVVVTLLWIGYSHG